MNQVGAERSGNAQRPRRALVIPVMVVILIVIDLIIVGLVLTTGREHDLTVRRLETAAAEYAAEAGVNMSIREMMENADEDGDGTIGSVSDDGNGSNDPNLNSAKLSVTISPDDPFPGQTTLTSEGRCGEAVRKMLTILE